MVRQRRCAYCDATLPEELGPAARYCCRAHRQRAYEARQDDVVAAMRRRIRTLERQLASFERVLDSVAERDEGCARLLADALRDETEAALAWRRTLAAGGPASPANS